MDCDSNPSLVNLGFIGSDASVSHIGPGATFSHSSSYISSKNPSVSGLSENVSHVVSVPMNVPDFLIFIETSTRPVLISIAQSHNIPVPFKSVVDVIRNLISDHISSGACLGSSLPACTLLNSSLCAQEPECDDSNDNLNADFQLDLKIYILSQLLKKLKLRALRRLLSQNNVDHDSNGSRSYLRRELKKYITRLRHGKCRKNPKKLMGLIGHRSCL
jgi:hypothetical protein